QPAPSRPTRRAGREAGARRPDRLPRAPLDGTGEDHLSHRRPAPAPGSDRHAARVGRRVLLLVPHPRHGRLAALPLSRPLPVPRRARHQGLAGRAHARRPRRLRRAGGRPRTRHRRRDRAGGGGIRQRQTRRDRLQPAVVIERKARAARRDAVVTTMPRKDPRAGLALVLYAALLAPDAARAARVDYRVGLGLAYDDNVTLSHHDPVSETILQPSLGFRISEDGSAVRAYVDGLIDYNDYLDGKYASEFRSQINGRLDWSAVPERLDFVVEDVLGVQPVNPLAANTP